MMTMMVMVMCICSILPGNMLEEERLDEEPLFITSISRSPQADRCDYTSFDDGTSNVSKRRERTAYHGVGEDEKGEDDEAEEGDKKCVSTSSAGASTSPTSSILVRWLGALWVAICVLIVFSAARTPPHLTPSPPSITTAIGLIPPSSIGPSAPPARGLFIFINSSGSADSQCSLSELPSASSAARSSEWTGSKQQVVLLHLDSCSSSLSSPVSDSLLPATALTPELILDLARQLRNMADFWILYGHSHRCKGRPSREEAEVVLRQLQSREGANVMFYDADGADADDEESWMPGGGTAEETRVRCSDGSVVVLGPDRLVRAWAAQCLTEGEDFLADDIDMNETTDSSQSAAVAAAAADRHVWLMPSSPSLPLREEASPPIDRVGDLVRLHRSSRAPYISEQSSGSLPLTRVSTSLLHLLLSPVATTEDAGDHPAFKSALCPLAPVAGEDEEWRTVSDDGLRQQYTMVTAFYDLGRDRWSEGGRSVDKYFENAVTVMKTPNPLLIITSADLIDKVNALHEAHRPPGSLTKVIARSLEAVPYYHQYHERGQAIMASKEYKRAIGRNNIQAPEYSNAAYDIVNWAKIGFLKHAATMNYFDTTHVAWIDFGSHLGLFEPLDEHVGREVPFHHNVSDVPVDQSRLRFLALADPQGAASAPSSPMDIAKARHDLLIGGLFGGHRRAILRFARAHAAAVAAFIESGVVTDDQDVNLYLYQRQSELFDIQVAPGWRGIFTLF